MLDETIKKEEKTRKPLKYVVCRYCGNSMHPASGEIDGYGHMYWYKCLACKSCSPVESTDALAYSSAMNLAPSPKPEVQGNESHLKELREEYMHGFDAGYKEGRSRGHGFSY